MKTLPSLFQAICWSLLLLISLSSFSGVPTADVRDDNPPVEKKLTKKDRRKARLNKRYNRLHERFDKATNSKQRLRLQKKIRQVERQQEGGSKVFLGIIAMVLGIISFIVLVVGIMALINAGINGLIAAEAAGPIFIIGVITAIAGLAMSIVYLALHRNDPDMYPLKGFGIAGIIVGSVMFAFLLIFTMFIFYFNI